MGAIQQAFNQGLAITALAASPIVRQKVEMRAEQKAITKAETGAEEALNRMEEVFGADNNKYSDQQMRDVLEEAYKAQETSYNKKPTLEKGALRAELYENLKEWDAEEPAKKAVNSVAATREQYKDQIAMLHSIAKDVTRWSNIQTKKGGAK